MKKPSTAEHFNGVCKEKTEQHWLVQLSETSQTESTCTLIDCNDLNLDENLNMVVIPSKRWVWFCGHCFGEHSMNG